MLRITTIAIAACLTLGVAASSAAAGHDVIIYSAPPDSLELDGYYDEDSGAYYRDGNERDGYVWEQGHWAYGEDDWVWIPGHWVEAQQDMVYVQGYWEPYNDGHRDGYRWCDARWEQRRSGYDWVPGSWSWSGHRYDWSTGYWKRQASRQRVRSYDYGYDDSYYYNNKPYTERTYDARTGRRTDGYYRTGGRSYDRDDDRRDARRSAPRRVEREREHRTTRPARVERRNETVKVKVKVRDHRRGR